MVHVDEDRAQSFCGGARPVLKWLFNEVGCRHDQATLVPDAHHHVGQGALLDASPLIFDSYHIVQTNGLGNGNLRTP